MKAPTKTQPAALCVHGRQDCPTCAAFTRSLIAAVESRDTAWSRGILGKLNAASERP